MDQVEIESRLKLVIQRLESVFCGLSYFGYEYIGCEKDQNLAIDFAMNCNFSNQKIDRNIRIHYEPIDFEKNDVDLITIRIEKISNPEENIYFVKFLEHCLNDYQFDRNSLLRVNYGKYGTFEENLEKTLNLNLMYLIEFGKSILDGNSWSDHMKLEIDDNLWDTLYSKQKDILGKKDRN